MVMRMNCDTTFTGEHLFNPRRIRTWKEIGPKFKTEYRCKCGALVTDKKATIRQLAATRAERRRQIEEAKRLTGVKRMTAQGVDGLPGFE